VPVLHVRVQAGRLEEDISAPGVAMLRALFDGVDPGANLNPGKIVGETGERRPLEHN
jgi:hypothetical protein